MWPNFVPFIYQYAVGGLFFFATLLLCFQSGAADFRLPSDRKALYYLLFGLAGYFLMHGGWILLASR